jgi:hypothetical protein
LNPMIRHGTTPWSGAALYSKRVADFEALGRLVLPSAQTVLLIVADSREVPVEEVARAAERLLAAGLIYVCVWGPDCERVHDIFDEVHVGDGTVEPEFTWMSTWHDDEPLEEAIWYFLQCASPPDGEMDGMSDLAVTIGNDAWADRVERALSDRDAFVARMLSDEPDTPTS